MSPRRQRAAWGAALVVIVLAAFAPAVAGRRTLSQRDTDRLFRPVRTLVVEALRAGRLPLWNPHEGTGKPLLAELNHGVLHPVSLAGAVLAPASVDFLVLAYLAAAALGAFLLGGALGTTPLAAAGAGVAYALSGFSVSMAGNLPFLAGLSTLPWLVAAASTAGGGARWGVVATALATACILLSGDPQVALVGVALGVALAAGAGGPRGAARAAAGVAVGTLLAGVQLAATVALLDQTYRDLAPGAGLSAWQKTQWALDPGRLVEWVVPGLYRGPLDVLPAPDGFPASVFAESVYLGAPLLVAAALGAARGRRRVALLLAAAAGLLLWLALGHHLGARQLLDGVPIWSRFRHSEKLMAALALCACALGALGIDAFAAARLPRRGRWALAGATLGAALLLAGLLAAPAATEALAAGLLGDAGPFLRARLAAGLPHLALGLAAVLAADRFPVGWPRAPALALAVGLAPAAGLPYGAHLGAHEARPLTTPMRLETDAPAPRLVHPSDVVLAPGQDQVEAEAAAWYRILLPSVNVAHRVDTFEPYGALAPRRLTEVSGAFGVAWARSFRRFGLTHVALPLPWDPRAREVAALAVEGGRRVQRDAAAGVEVWEVPHRPWAFFPARAVAAAGFEEALDALLGLVARGDDATVVVEAATAPPAGPGRVLRVERGAEVVRVEAEAPGPALLVLQDAWWPGWRAAIDGQPAELLPADALVRAIRWPAGRHTLELTYQPPELRLGLAVSGAGALLLLALVILAARRRRPGGAA